MQFDVYIFASIRLLLYIWTVKEGKKNEAFVAKIFAMNLDYFSTMHIQYRLSNHVC